MDFKKKKANNIWENNFDKTISFIKEATKDEFDGWSWIKNGRCKYISLRIDMRDGGFIILDRDGNRISLEELKHQ